LGWREVEQAFDEAVGAGVMPGATAVVRRGEEIVFEGAFGCRSLVPERTPVSLETVFDLSSLTKALATSVAVMLLSCDGRLRLEDRVTRFFHNFAVHGKSGVTFRHLLAHCSGLPAWRPFYQRIAEVERGGKVNFMATHEAKEFVYDAIHREKPEAAPGKKTIYSDLGFILLGQAVEQLSGFTLDRFCRRRIFHPLGLESIGFIDISMTRSRHLKPVAAMFAPTEICPWRKRLLVGEVDDENAYAMGGVAGHAGMFAPAREVDALVHELIACYAGRGELVPQSVIRRFWSRDGTVDGSTWALGWDNPSAEGSSSGHHFSPAAVGHLGFTGPSIWIEPEREIAVTLLTNRVHPRRDNEAIRAFRPKIHDLIMEAIEGD